jgi:hypothetical protein
MDRSGALTCLAEKLMTPNAPAAARERATSAKISKMRVVEERPRAARS